MTVRLLPTRRRRPRRQSHSGRWSSRMSGSSFSAATASPRPRKLLPLIALTPLSHTHPLGQTLIVTSGCGFVQSWGGPIKVIRPGDVVWCPAGEKHWHGASPTTAMTHIAIQEELNGKVVDWMEKVTDEQYQGLRDEQ